MDSMACFPVGAIGLQLQRRGRIDIARIAIRVFVQPGWVAGTILAADMLAVLAFLGAAGKGCPTRMAVSSHTLPHRLADQILST